MIYDIYKYIIGDIWFSCSKWLVHYFAFKLFNFECSWWRSTRFPHSIIYLYFYLLLLHWLKLWNDNSLTENVISISDEKWFVPISQPLIWLPCILINNYVCAKIQTVACKIYAH